MPEIEFADGKHLVDDAYVSLINDVTNGAPERFGFQSVMDRLANQQEKNILQRVHRNIVEEHLRQWG